MLQPWHTPHVAVTKDPVFQERPHLCILLGLQNAMLRGFEPSVIVDDFESQRNPGYHMNATFACMISEIYRTMIQDIPSTSERHPRFSISNIKILLFSIAPKRLLHQRAYLIDSVFGSITMAQHRQVRVDEGNATMLLAVAAENYFREPISSSILYLHIGFMILAWIGALPIRKYLPPIRTKR